MTLGRLLTNVSTLVVLTGVLVAYALFQWVGGAFLEDRYELVVPMSETGGLVPNQEVTVLGRGVGQVKATRLTDAGVEIVLDIRGEESVPSVAVMQILRRSALGEQALNFIPVPPNYEPPPGRFYPSAIEPVEGWEAAPRGTRVEPILTVYPTEVPELLERAIELFEAIDLEDLGIVVHELADAVGGRAELLKDLNRDSLDLNRTLVSGIPDFERLIESSGPVLDELNEHRESLADLFPEFADLSDLLAEERPTIEGLIDSGRAALAEGQALVVNSRANQHCLMNDFREVNALVARPENLNDLSRSLRQHHFFYDGADIISQWDPYRPGVIWQRINFLIFEEFGGVDYVPDRPTPQTRPGAACQSPWGVGVNAVRQADHQPPDETAPPIDFAPLVQGGSQSRGATGADDRGAAAPDRQPSRGAAAADRGVLPETGGGMLAVVPVLILAVGWALRRRP